jgi:hypothetical protein
MTRRRWRLGAGVLLLLLSAAAAGCGSQEIGAASAPTPVALPATASGAVASGDPTSTSSSDTSVVPTSSPVATTASPPTTPAPTTPPSTSAPTTPSTTTAPSTSSSTSTTVPSSTTTKAPATTSSSTSVPWGWIVAGVLIAAALIIIAIALIRRNNRIRALQAWRQHSESALDAARLAANLLPRSGQDVPDLAHWQDVRERVEQAAQALERSSASAPTEEGALAATTAAETLRGLFFALDSDRLLRDGAVAPTTEQLVQADAVTRARRTDLDNALARLEFLIRPPARG